MFALIILSLNAKNTKSKTGHVLIHKQKLLDHLVQTVIKHHCACVAYQLTLDEHHMIYAKQLSEDNIPLICLQVPLYMTQTKSSLNDNLKLATVFCIASVNSGGFSKHCYAL